MTKKPWILRVTELESDGRFGSQEGVNIALMQQSKSPSNLETGTRDMPVSSIFQAAMLLRKFASELPHYSSTSLHMGDREDHEIMYVFENYSEDYQDDYFQRNQAGFPDPYSELDYFERVVILKGFSSTEREIVHGFVFEDASPYFEGAKRLLSPAVEQLITARADLIQEILDTFWKTDSTEFLLTAESSWKKNFIETPRKSGLMLAAQRIRKSNPLDTIKSTKFLEFILQYYSDGELQDEHDFPKVAVMNELDAAMRMQSATFGLPYSFPSNYQSVDMPFQRGNLWKFHSIYPFPADRDQTGELAKVMTFRLIGFSQAELEAIEGFLQRGSSKHREKSRYIEQFDSAEELEAKRIIPRAIEKRITARPDLVQEISEAFWKMDNKEYIETARSIEAFDPEPSPREAGLMLAAQKIRKGNPRRRKRR